MKRLGVLRNAAIARLSHFLTTPAWRRIKFLADRVLLVAVLGAIGWTAVNGVFVAQRAATNRTQVLVRLAGPPTLGHAVVAGRESANAAPPTVVLAGVQSARIEIAIANDATDGASFKGGTLTGPYLSGNTKLAPDISDGYVMGHGTIHLVGTITVDCDAAIAVTHALVAGRQGTTQPVTNLTITLTDTDGALHSVILTVDTTAFAIQGRVCSR